MSYTIKDPLERATSYREEGNVRKHLKAFGYHEDNRGTLGISSYHVHEVAWSCLDGVLEKRYKVVDAVRVPEAALKDWRLTQGYVLGYTLRLFIYFRLMVAKLVFTKNDPQPCGFILPKFHPAASHDDPFQARFPEIRSPYF